MVKSLAIHIVRGFYGLAFMSALYLGIKEGIVASSLSNNVNVIQPNQDGQEGYHEYANYMAKEVGINKEIAVIAGRSFTQYGSNLFSIRAGIQIALDEDLTDEAMCHMMIHEIAHIKSNDILTWTFLPLIVSIFTVVVLSSRFPMFACAAGLATGGISYAAVHRWREKQAMLTAIKYSSREMNEAFLKWVKKRDNSADSLKKQCLKLFYVMYHPSVSEIIACYQNHLGIKV
jgi:hypothetical protein